MLSNDKGCASALFAAIAAAAFWPLEDFLVCAIGVGNPWEVTSLGRYLSFGRDLDQIVVTSTIKTKWNERRVIELSRIFEDHAHIGHIRFFFETVNKYPVIESIQLIWDSVDVNLYGHTGILQDTTKWPPAVRIRVGIEGHERDVDQEIVRPVFMAAGGTTEISEVRNRSWMAQWLISVGEPQRESNVEKRVEALPEGRTKESA
ncbi:hypothetical protein B0H16DRAFT_1684294 [Mycena metata]|uniref:Uncharacterized protein n=1 Tax=Mycena metata TaxID=1033252 RepID=A0AAD7K237_9AGAR|nr:hypothetical protein B0H16DRAFT_1684294 [Mycena metata]